MELLELANMQAKFNVAVGTWAKSTPEAYARDYRKFIRFLDSVGVAPRIESITKPLVHDFTIWLAEQGNSPATVQRGIRALKVLLDYAVERSLIPSNPCDGLHFKKDRTKKRRAPTDEQYRALLEDTGGYNAKRNRAIVALFLTTGIRRNELLNLNWGDIDLSGGTLYIRAAKGHQSRDLPLGEETIQRLKELLGSRVPDPDEPVFLSRLNKRMSKTALRSVTKRAAKRSGIDPKDFCNHSMRHGFINRVARKYGLELARIMAGHQDITTTALYVHPADWEKRQVAKDFDMLFRIRGEKETGDKKGDNNESNGQVRADAM